MQVFAELCFEVKAVVDDQVGIEHRLNVLGGRAEGVRVDAGATEEVDVGVGAGSEFLQRGVDLAGSGDDLQGCVVRVGGGLV